MRLLLESGDYSIAAFLISLKSADAKEAIHREMDTLDTAELDPFADEDEIEENEHVLEDC